MHSIFSVRPEAPKRPRTELDDAKQGNDEVQGNNSEMESVGADLREHIEAQLMSASPIFEFGSTALHQAAEKGLGGAVARLLAACPFLSDVPNEHGWTAFHLAAQNGRAAIVSQLLAVKPAVIDARTKDGCTALHLAAENGKAEVVAQLLAANPALIEARTDEDGFTALHLAARTGRQEIVTQLLSANPTSIEARANDGRTALHFAFLALFGSEIIAAQLLAAKPSLIEDIINGDNSWTALLNVIKVDHEEAVAQLLAMHPELIHQSRGAGWTVFHEAASFGSNKAMSRLLAAVPQPDLETLLLERSSSCGFTIGGSTALHVAAGKGDSNIVTQLLAACPTLVDILDDQGRTCLHCACSSQSTVEVLLAFKPDLIHAVDAYGNTILHSICQTSPQQSGRELIEKVWRMKPDALHVANRHGKTPFHCAVAESNESAIDLLQRSVTVDEIESAYNMFGRVGSRERLKPLMELHCEELVAKLLPDVVATVLEYLGFARGPLKVFPLEWSFGF